MLEGFVGPRFAKGIVIVIMALLSGLALYVGLQLPRLDAALAQFARANLIQRELAHLRDDASDIETGARGFLLTVDDTYLAPYRTGIADASERLPRLQSALAGDAESLRRLAEISQTLGRKIEVVNRYVRLAQAGDMAAALAVVREGSGKRLMDEFRGQTDGLAARWQVLTAQMEQDVTSHERTVVISVAIVVALALLLILLAWEVHRRYADAIEDAARQSRSILDSLAEGVVKQSADGAIVAANRCAAEILGLTNAQLMGRDSFDPRWSTILEDGTPCPGEQHPAMVALNTGREVRGFVMGINKPEGERAWLLINALPIAQSPSGRPVAVVTSFLDITSLREEHQTRIASEARIRALFDNAPDAIIVRDAEGRILEANRSATRMWGYTHAELLNMNVTDIGHDMTPSDATQVVRQASLGEVMSLARVHRRKDGQLIPTETSITAVVEHGERRILAVVRDVSRQREAELALARSEERLQAILGQVPAAIGHFDENGVCQYANAALRTRIGGHRGTLIDRRVEDLVPLSTETGSAQAYDAVRRGRIAHFECADTDPTGRPRYAAVALIPDTAADHAGAFFCLVTDTTELTAKVLQRTTALDTALEALRAALRAKDEFLENASHEMRTPLHAIRSFADLAAKRQPAAGSADEKLSRYLANIQEAAARLSHFIEDLLELVRLQSGAVVHAEPLDARQHIDSAVADMDAERSARKVSLRVVVETADTRLMADGKMLDRLLRSLFSNAIKFSRAGGEITVSIRDDHVESRNGELVSGLRITVSDRGVGIPEDELEHVFEKFQQSTRTQTGAGGAGLGLSICRAILLQHGGTISARNLPDGGAAIDAVFPRSPVPSVQSDARPDVTQPGRLRA